MITKIKHFLVGTVAGIFYLFNLLWVTSSIFLVSILKIYPDKSWKSQVDYFLHNYVVGSWIRINSFIAKKISQVKFEIHFLNDCQFNKKKKYILISNHLSWADIFVLQNIFANTIPTLAFFMKKSLVWQFPIIGLAAYSLSYPLMDRAKKKTLKNKKNRLHDFHNTKNFCDNTANIPLTIVNYIESTRFTTEKREKLLSPYIHLLKPRPSMLAVAIQEMKQNLAGVIDTTIIYDQKEPCFIDFLSGKIRHIKVFVKLIDIEDIPEGDYTKNRDFRIVFQSWINNIWKEKDQLIENNCSFKA